MDQRRTVLTLGEPDLSGFGLLPPGRVIAGYRIEGLAGAGGMGVVYRAGDPELGRQVALKLIAPATPRTSASASCSSESRAAGLEHPNVIPIYRAGEDEGRLYIAMRYVEGASLQDLIAERGRVPPGRAARVVARVADALDAAHARGLVHRDVKPANVLIADPDGEEHVYLTDFGLARPVGRERARRRRQVGRHPRLPRPGADPGRAPSTPAPTSTRSAACSSTPSPAARRSPPATRRRRARGAPHPGRRPSLPTPCRACRRRSTRSCAGRWPSAPRTASRPPASSAGRRWRRATTSAILPRRGRRRRRGRGGRAPRGGGPAAARPRRRDDPARPPRASAPRAPASSWSGARASATGPARAWPPPKGSAAATAPSALVLVLLPGGAGAGSTRASPTSPDHPWIDLRAGVADPHGVSRPGPRRCAAPTSGRASPARGRRLPLPRPRGLPRGGRRPLLRPRGRTSRAWSSGCARRASSPCSAPRAAARARSCAAGLIPAVRAARCRRRAWRVLEPPPGARPLAALAAQLRHLPGRRPSAADLAADERCLDLAVARALEGRPPASAS